MPSVYIVSVERFMPRDGSFAWLYNLVEFDFPVFFNYFVLQNQFTLIVDSDDAKYNIRRVFNETLLGPSSFRRFQNLITDFN